MTVDAVMLPLCSSIYCTRTRIAYRNVHENVLGNWQAAAAANRVKSLVLCRYGKFRVDKYRNMIYGFFVCLIRL